MPRLLAFAIPLTLTSLLQFFYNAADMIVVGQFAGAEALAAVGATTALIRLMTQLFIGLSVGAGVVIARWYGAGNTQKVHQCVHTSILLGVLIGFAVGAAGILLSRPLLMLMDCPADVLDGATLYMQIFFLGMPGLTLYNFGAAALRAMGDTRRPLMYLTLSGFLNVVLNLLLVIVFHMGVAGVAIATVASQYVSTALVLACMTRTTGAAHLDWSKLRLYAEHVRDIIRIGIPAGLQSCMFSLSNVLIQSSINTFGAAAIAGNTAGTNLDGIIGAVSDSLMQASMTFSSQNMGAGKYRRVRSCMWLCGGATVLVGVVCGGVFLLFGEQLLSLYNSDPEVIHYGMVRFRGLMPLFCIGNLVDMLAGQARGMGYSFAPMVISLVCICLSRIVWLYTVFAAARTLEMLFVSYPVSWILAAIAHSVCLTVIYRRLPAERTSAC